MTSASGKAFRLRHQQAGDVGRFDAADAAHLRAQPPAVDGALNKDNTPEDLQYNYDPEKAKALLAEAGQSNLTFDVFCSERDDYASQMLIIRENLRQVGVTMNLTLMDHTAYHAEKEQGSQYADPSPRRLPGRCDCRASRTRRSPLRW